VKGLDKLFTSLYPNIWGLDLKYKINTGLYGGPYFEVHVTIPKDYPYIYNQYYLQSLIIHLTYETSSYLYDNFEIFDNRQVVIVGPEGTYIPQKLNKELSELVNKTTNTLILNNGYEFKFNGLSNKKYDITPDGVYATFIDFVFTYDNIEISTTSGGKKYTITSESIKSFKNQLNDFLTQDIQYEILSYLLSGVEYSDLQDELFTTAIKYFPNYSSSDAPWDDHSIMAYLVCEGFTNDKLAVSVNTSEDLNDTTWNKAHKVFELYWSWLTGQEQSDDFE